MNKEYSLPEFLLPELELLDKRLDDACRWVQKNRKDIHHSISFIDAVHFRDMGIDVTQLNKKQNNRKL